MFSPNTSGHPGAFPFRQQLAKPVFAQSFPFPNQGSLNKKISLRTTVARCVFYPTKIPDSGIFWRALEWKMLVHYVTIWNILGHLVYVLYGNIVFFTVVIW
jgi:hypothetical protein